MRSFSAATLLVLSLAAVGCADLLTSDGVAPIEGPSKRLVTLDCTASLVDGRMSCSAPVASGGQRVVIGNQGVHVRLTSTNVSYDAATDTFYADVTVQNLLNEAIGTPDGSMPDPEGIQVFFDRAPSATEGEGTVTVANPDGEATFTGAEQPYFAYHEILAKDQVSGAKTWKFLVPDGVTRFTFRVALEMDVQYLLVINEVLVNPAGNFGVTYEREADWIELYNAGTLPVEMQGLLVADSAASGRQPYHLIASSIVIPSGGYAVFAGSTNTTNNGGLTADYSWGAALSLANSLDAVKVARVFGTDTLTVDRTQYSSASTSAKDGISRELKNPALDNSNMDGSNWGDASVTSVYGAGGRGTPKAQNSAYTP